MLKPEDWNEDANPLFTVMESGDLKVPRERLIFLTKNLGIISSNPKLTKIQVKKKSSLTSIYSSCSDIPRLSTRTSNGIDKRELTSNTNNIHKLTDRIGGDNCSAKYKMPCESVPGDCHEGGALQERSSCVKQSCSEETIPPQDGGFNVVSLKTNIGRLYDQEMHNTEREVNRKTIKLHDSTETNTAAGKVKSSVSSIQHKEKLQLLKGYKYRLFPGSCEIKRTSEVKYLSKNQGNNGIKLLDIISNSIRVSNHLLEIRKGKTRLMDKKQAYMRPSDGGGKNAHCTPRESQIFPNESTATPSFLNYYLHFCRRKFASSTESLQADINNASNIIQSNFSTNSESVFPTLTIENKCVPHNNTNEISKPVMESVKLSQNLTSNQSSPQHNASNCKCETSDSPKIQVLNVVSYRTNDEKTVRFITLLPIPVGKREDEENLQKPLILKIVSNLESDKLAHPKSHALEVISIKTQNPSNGIPADTRQPSTEDTEECPIEMLSFNKNPIKTISHTRSDSSCISPASNDPISFPNQVNKSGPTTNIPALLTMQTSLDHNGSKSITDDGNKNDISNPFENTIHSTDNVMNFTDFHNEEYHSKLNTVAHVRSVPNCAVSVEGRDNGISNSTAHGFIRTDCWCQKTLRERLSRPPLASSSPSMDSREQLRVDLTKIYIPVKEDIQDVICRKIRNAQYPDCKVLVAGQEIKCHLLVLIHFADYFTYEFGETCFEIPASSKVSPEMFKAVYRWMIGTEEESRNEIMQADALELLQAATFLKVRELEDQCWALLNNKQVFTEEAALEMMLHAHSRGCMNVMEAMLPRIVSVFLPLVSASMWLQLPVHVVCMLLSSNFVAVHSEMEIFNAAVRWLNHNWDSRKELTVRVMSCIRFGLMSACQIVQLMRCSNNQEHEAVKSVPGVKKLMKEGLSYASVACYSGRKLDLIAPVARNWIREDKTSSTANL